MMSYKKPFLIVFTALVLACSIPVSASAISPFDDDLAYYTYGIQDEEDYVSTSTSPWYDITINNTQICGRVHCRGGHVNKAFLLFIPFMGYYLVVSQEGSMRIDFDLANGRHAFYHCYNYGGDVQQTYFSFSGDGYLSQSNRSCFQDVFFGQYWVFMQISASNAPDPTLRSSLSNFEIPTPQEEDTIKDKINDNRGQDKPFPSGGGDVDIVDSNTTVVTNPYGQPVPTNAFGEDPTYPNDEPVITYTQPGETKIYTVPWNDDIDEPYSTIIYQSVIYILKPNEVAVTDPDTGEVLPDPDDSSKPWIEQVTIYNNENGQSDINNEFSKLNDIISDMDDLSSIMESNQEVMSGHADNVRNLVETVTGWFPAPIIACMVCGAIMIIAVKITGSGKS